MYNIDYSNYDYHINYDAVDWFDFHISNECYILCIYQSYFIKFYQFNIIFSIVQ